jgi:beta-glucosidase
MIRTRRHAAVVVGAMTIVASMGATTQVSSGRAAASTASSCPWVAQSRSHSATPTMMANEVLARMTLAQKAAFVVLVARYPLQSSNTGVPSLCIPALSLTDGPGGLGAGLRGVTQFPAAIAIAATFNTAVARAEGRVVADEARTKGIMAVQGTELNLARVPQSGRIFETYGEDPYLSSILGVANIEGIQSQGVMDVAKHFSAYTQETARVRLDQIVSPRTLAELYDVPFLAAVRQAHVASLMCSYGKLNGVNTCSDPNIYATLERWGFTGFVRSDLKAVKNVAQAFRAGMALIKPASAATIMRLVDSKALPASDLNRAVRDVLATMFRFGVIAHPPIGSLWATATSAAHAAVALRAAENSIVLLKNAGVLPLAKATTVAVIGDPASQTPFTTGGGSSKVIAPYVVTPLSAIKAALGPKVTVLYRPGGPAGLELDQLNDVDIVGGSILQHEAPIKTVGEAGKADLAIVDSPNVTPALATATAPGKGEGWISWGVKLRAKKTGTYEVSFQQIGDSWLYLNGRQIIGSSGLHIREDLATTVSLVKGRDYKFSAKWFAVRNHAAPRFGIQDVTPQIQSAVAAARKAKFAIVFAGDYNQEGADRSNLYLPGVSNPLISAVAAVNPRTIVVLNTGGAVYMPWLSHVAAVLEAWYPGQEDGAAIAAILTGRVDPSGHLPITFPASEVTMPIIATSEFPGINAVVNFANGLDIGYRWYQVNQVAPLFPFGFGLSYTTFKLSNEVVKKTTDGVSVEVTVTNVGSRTGADVIQVYVRFPVAAGEPPEQLRAFARIDLAPSTSRRLTLLVPNRGLQSFQSGSWTTLAGQYGIDIGESSANLTLHANVNLP